MDIVQKVKFSSEKLFFVQPKRFWHSHSWIGFPKKWLGIQKFRSLLTKLLGLRDMQKLLFEIRSFHTYIHKKIIGLGTYLLRIVNSKGQLISKCLFGVFKFFQKTNEKIRLNYWVLWYLKWTCFRSFFGGNRRHQKTI